MFGKKVRVSACVDISAQKHIFVANKKANSTAHLNFHINCRESYALDTIESHFHRIILLIGMSPRQNVESSCTCYLNGIIFYAWLYSCQRKTALCLR